jgi:tRNA nucleotidyltransferase/poly(A) polymerase
MKKVINIPQIVKDIAKVLIDNGNKAFVVGGAVRDAVMGTPCKDIDIATDLFVDDVIDLFKDLEMTEDIKKTGDKFPVARIFTNTGDEFEIATFRADVGEGKDTDFEVVSDIDGDVHRRDFTFNALFAKADTGEVVDLVGGIKDLEDGIIRFVGDSRKRINEDRTRLLRMVRFKEKFGFKVANLETILEDVVLIEGLDEKDQVKKEMIINEMVKGLDQAKDNVSFINTLIEFGLMKQAFPGSLINNAMISFDHIELMLAQILSQNRAADVAKVMAKMKWSSDQCDRVQLILRFSQIPFIPRTDHKNFMIADLFRLTTKIKSCGLDKILDEFAIKILFGEDKSSLVRALLKFERSVKNTDFPEIPNGPELGKAILEKEMENLIKLL